MGSALFWWLVFPMLLIAGIVYLGILIVGFGTFRVAAKSRGTVTKLILLVAALAIVASPVLYHFAMDLRAQAAADERQEMLAKLERADLTGRMPTRFITLGTFHPEQIDLITKRYRLRPFPDAENKRLVDAYRAYRRAELCHRVSPGKMMPGTQIPVCKRLPDSLQSAMKLREPVLVFVNGRDASLREDRVMAGKIYEIRLVTPTEDLLVNYYEERTVKGTPSIFNPYAPPKRRDSDERAPTLSEFIETSLEGASR